MFDGLQNVKFPSVITGMKHVATKNVLSPLVILAMVSTVLPIGVAIFAVEHFVLAFGLPVATWIFVSVAYVYWSFKDPDRLQDEKTLINMRRLKVLGDNDKNPGVEAITIDSEPVANTSPQVSGAIGHDDV